NTPADCFARRCIVVMGALFDGKVDLDVPLKNSATK
ncbi:MAG: hypothetical protein QOF81_952, partial [Acidimicrobiaceae bacterium]|nr:hypothetical protein [Acidimicrobiaceae bacterium]